MQWLDTLSEVSSVAQSYGTSISVLYLWISFVKWVIFKSANEWQRDKNGTSAEIELIISSLKFDMHY